MSLIYLASPYSHPDPKIKEARFDLVSFAAVELMKRGLFVFSPICYNHPMTKYNLPGDWAFWAEYDKAFIRKCDALIVLRIDGWERSVGVTAEVDYAESLGLKIFYLGLEDCTKQFIIENINEYLLSRPQS